MDGPGVDAPEEVEVISVEKGAVDDVDFSYATGPWLLPASCQ